MTEPTKHVPLFDRSIARLFRQALGQSLTDPGRAVFLWRTVIRQRRAVRLRKTWSERGTQVPPLMILSITDRCNLRCKGCYAQAHRKAGGGEMDAVKLRKLLGQARDLGVSIVLVAGGEPLTRPEILDITADFPEIIFPLFTNGLLLQEEIMVRLKMQPHVIPVISLEGREQGTDARRGDGVYGRLLRSVKLLKERRIFFGVSFTMTSANWAEVTDESFLRGIIKDGCGLFFFVDYVPIQAQSEYLLLSEAHRNLAMDRITHFQEKLPGLFIAFPGDEEQYGGCLAAGRGFVHVNPSGGLEPCPFAPFSDVNVGETSLKVALESKLLSTIRRNSGRLTETGEGCALWANRGWIETLARAEGGDVPG